MASSCDSCTGGTLFARKQYRLGAGFVVLGYIALTLSALGLLFGAGMVWLAWAFARAELPAEARAEMDRAGVPVELRAKVARREAISDADLKALAPEQQKAVRDGQARMGAQTLAFGFAAGLVGISGAILGVLSLPLLAGWLLVRRRRVLVCDCCGAVTG